MKRIFLFLTAVAVVASLCSCDPADESNTVSTGSANISEEVSIGDESTDVSIAESDETSSDATVDESNDENVGDDVSDESSGIVDVVMTKDISVSDIRDMIFSELETVIANYGEPSFEYTLDGDEKWYYFDELGYSVGVMPDSNSIDCILIHSESALEGLGIKGSTLLKIDGSISPGMTFEEVNDIWGDAEVQSIYDKSSGKRTYFAEFTVDGMLFEISTSLSDGSEDAHIVDKILITME